MCVGLSDTSANAAGKLPANFQHRQTLPTPPPPTHTHTHTHTRTHTQVSFKHHSTIVLGRAAPPLSESSWLGTPELHLLASAWKRPFVVFASKNDVPYYVQVIPCGSGLSIGAECGSLHKPVSCEQIASFLQEYLKKPLYTGGKPIPLLFSDWESGNHWGGVSAVRGKMGF